MFELQTVATNKVIKKKALSEARKTLDVGQHDVDFWLHIDGSVTVGEDYNTAGTVAIPFKKAFALLAYTAGCTGKAGINKIKEAMILALADESDITAQDALKLVCPMVDTIEREVIQPMLNALPTIRCDGKVTTKLNINFDRVRGEV